jgi:hypothetical protein
MTVELITDAAPDFCLIDMFVRIELLRFVHKDFCRLRISGIGNATVIDWTHGGALRFIEMANALSAAIVRDDIDIIANSLAVAHVVSLRFRIAAGFEDRLIGALG